jgi:hypothetical protein
MVTLWAFFEHIHDLAFAEALRQRQITKIPRKLVGESHGTAPLRLVLIDGAKRLWKHSGEILTEK